MSNMTIAELLFPAAVTNVAPANGTPLSNLLTWEPKEAATFGHVNPSAVDVDMGEAVTIDQLFAGFLVSAGAHQVTLYSATGLGAGLVARGSIGAGAVGRLRRHAVLTLAGAVTSRYWRLEITTPGIFSLGILAFGKTFRPTWNREWGSGRGIIDTGTKEALRGGGFGIAEGARKGSYSWTFGDLSDAEIETLYDLALRTGETRPMLVVEDPDDTPGLNERVHYGLFNRFEEYGRQNPEKNRWSLSMAEWV